MTDFRALLTALARANVDFIVVGGLAATVHGSSRLTQDLDVLYSRTPENLQRLSQAIAPLRPSLRGAPTGLPFTLDAATLRKGLHFTLSTSAGDLDLLGELSAAGTYATLAGCTVNITLFGVAVRCLDLRALIEEKRAAGRPKDLEVIAELEALEEENGRE